MANTQSPPAAPAAQLRWVLALTSTAYFMVILDTGALFAALPRMQRDLHADLASLQWAVNSYGIALPLGYSPLQRSGIGLAGVGSSTSA